jgi:hypothetical protein
MMGSTAYGLTRAGYDLAGAVACGIVLAPKALALTLAVIAVGAAFLFVPLKWLSTGVIFGLLTTPLYNIGSFLPADLAVAAALVIATARGRLGTLGGYPRPWLAFFAWAVLVTGLTPGLVPLLHTFAPVAGGYLVACLCGPAHMWRAVRWWAVLAICTAPLLIEDIGNRWTGLPGGPNDLGLIAAALIVLAYAAEVGSRWRYAQLALGFIGLAGTLSISGGVSAIVGVLLLRQRRPERTPSLSIFKLALIGGVAILIASRPDLLTTIDVHANQAGTTAPILEDTNWLTGGGWLHGAEYIATESLDVVFYHSAVLLETVHNAYLQLLTDTGIIGLVLFLAALLTTWYRSGREGRAVVAAVAVWLNTSGAYPNAVWGLLGISLAAAAWNTEPVPVRRALRHRQPPSSLAREGGLRS